MRYDKIVFYTIAVCVLFFTPAFAGENSSTDEGLEPSISIPLFDIDNDCEVVVFLVDSTESMKLSFGGITRFERVKNEILKTAGRFSGNVKVGVITFSSGDQCKYSGAKKSEMGDIAYLSKFYWWAYKGQSEGGTLALSDVAFIWDGPYTRELAPALTSDAAMSSMEAFLEKTDLRGMSSMPAGILAALKVKNVGTILMAADGPPEVMVDGREWKLSGQLPDIKEWRESPFFRQGAIPKNGIDGYAKEIAEKGGLQNVHFCAVYFDMPDWGVKLLEELAAMCDGAAFQIKN